MALPSTIGFIIKPKFDTTASKGLREQSKLLRDQKKDVTELGKTQVKAAREAEKAMKDAATATRGLGATIATEFRRAAPHLEQYAKGVDTLRDKLSAVKGVLVGGFIGGAALYGLKKLLDQGSSAERAEGRARRGFGKDAAYGKNAAGLIDRGNSAAKFAGLDDDDALKGLTPIAEAIGATQKDDVFRGKKLTAAQAQAIRKQTFEATAKRFERMSIMAPELDSTTIGEALAGAGEGPEGMRRLASQFGLDKVYTRKLTEANEKGKLKQFLGADEFKKLNLGKGVTKAGQGTMIDLAMAHSGITDEAAKEQRGTFDFQIKAVGASMKRAFGDIGQQTVKALNAELGKGKSIAERFEEAISSEKGKRAINAMADAATSLVTGLLKALETLPRIIDFVERHKTALTIAAGIGTVGAVAAGSAYYAGKVITGGREVLGAFGLGGKKGGPGGAAGDAISSIFGGGKPIPVYIVPGPLGAYGNAAGGGLNGLNAGGFNPATGGKLAKVGSFLSKAGAVTGVGLAAYELTSMLVEATGIDNKLAGGAVKEDSGSDKRSAAMVARVLAARKAKVAQLEKAGLDHGMAVYAREHPGETFEAKHINNGQEQTIAVTLQLDGQVLSKVVTKHQARQVKAHTAGGAAPTGK